MTGYSYDGSFDGLLTVYDAVFTLRVVPSDIAPSARSQETLFAASREIETSFDKADAFAQRVRSRIGEDAFGHVWLGYLSDMRGKEMMLWEYLAFGFEKGARADRYLSDGRVERVHRISRRVGCEAHRMKGLVRFREGADGMYYAFIEPDHNILALIAGYFVRRLGDRPWIIADLRRKIAACYDTARWDIREVSGIGEARYSGRELENARLWQEYCRRISIPQRNNPAQQARCMPRRYWKYLVEMEGRMEL